MTFVQGLYTKSRCPFCLNLISISKLNKYFIVSIFNKETYSNVFQILYSNPFISKLSSYQNPWALLLQ